MGGQQSKLHVAVLHSDINQIKALHTEGQNLECFDEEWRTPLILACMRSDLIDAAKVLIDLGADVNAYASGFDAGTALHHAAERGLDQTVKLLLKSGANPREMNDGCHTPLDLARRKGHCNVVRALEEHMCLFCGWMRILDGLSIVEAFAPQWVQKQIWVVILPRITPNLFDLVYYSNKQALQPEDKILLWRADIDVPNYNLPDPAVFITDKSSRIWYKFLSSRKGDKEQLQRFYKACLGLNK